MFSLQKVSELIEYHLIPNKSQSTQYESTHSVKTYKNQTKNSFAIRKQIKKYGTVRSKFDGENQITPRQLKKMEVERLSPAGEISKKNDLYVQLVHAALYYQKQQQISIYFFPRKMTYSRYGQVRLKKIMKL